MVAISLCLLPTPRRLTDKVGRIHHLTAVWLQPTHTALSCVLLFEAVTLAPDQPGTSGTSEARDMQALENHTLWGINSVISSRSVQDLLPTAGI